MDFFTPLYLSCVAGMATCIGAACVFCQQANVDGNKSVRPSQMCFSLSLAGSVMVTVSVVSILPECLRDDSASSVHSSSYEIISFGSTMFFERSMAFGIGCLLYLLLSKFAFPEPNEILELEDKGKIILLSTPQRRHYARDSSFSSSTSSGSDDIETQKRDQSNNSSVVANEKTRKRRNEAGKLTKHSESFTEMISQQPQLAPEEDSSVTINRREEEIATTIATKEERNGGSDFLEVVTRYSSGSDLQSGDARRAWRVAMLLFVSLVFHNFPEGLAVAASALESQKLGLTVTIGIMIHNIPEGIAIAVPCLAARPDQPFLAFWLAALSGLAEPMGAFVALIAFGDINKMDDGPEKDDNSLRAYFNIDNVLAFVAGIMIMVACIELIPEACRYSKKGNRFPFVSGIISGVAIMLSTELYLPL